MFLFFTGALGLLAAIYGICGSWWVLGTVAICLIFFVILDSWGV